MRIFISGICGFAGSCIAHALLDEDPEIVLCGIDNFSRPGSEMNAAPLRARKVNLIHGDVRCWTDLEAVDHCDWLIDAAANPSVLGGVDGVTSPRQVVENNLYGTVNLLELARRWRSGFILLSTSRVYSLPQLSILPMIIEGNAFHLDCSGALPAGVSSNGVTEEFSTKPPLSFYGSSKLASEVLALEYGNAFDLPVWINRCGVLAGAGQFGRPDQGIFTYWINAYLRKAALRYIGFGGSGYQTRDCLHPRDLAALLKKQMRYSGSGKPRVVNFGGGLSNSMSLAQLSEWCAQRFGTHHIQQDPVQRQFDVPWLALDTNLAREVWSWQPTIKLEDILEEIARHAEAHPQWLQISAGTVTR